MKINFKARLKNKTFIVSIATLLITFVYQLLSMFEVVPAVSESTVINLLGMVVNLLAGLGVIPFFFVNIAQHIRFHSHKCGSQTKM